MDGSPLDESFKHNMAISAISYNQTKNLLLSGSWDKSFCGWDVRSNHNNVFTTSLEQKIYTMDTKENYAVIGTSERCIYVYDIRKPSQAIQKRISSLRYGTRSVAFSPKSDGNNLVKC